MAKVEVGLSAQRIYQDLGEESGFTDSYGGNRLNAQTLVPFCFLCFLLFKTSSPFGAVACASRQEFKRGGNRLRRSNPCPLLLPLLPSVQKPLLPFCAVARASRQGIQTWREPPQTLKPLSPFASFASFCSKTSSPLLCGRPCVAPGNSNVAGTASTLKPLSPFASFASFCSKPLLPFCAVARASRQGIQTWREPPQRSNPCPLLLPLLPSVQNLFSPSVRSPVRRAREFRRDGNRVRRSNPCSLFASFASFCSKTSSPLLCGRPCVAPGNSNVAGTASTLKPLSPFTSFASFCSKPLLPFGAVACASRQEFKRDGNRLNASNPVPFCFLCFLLFKTSSPLLSSVLL